MKAEGCERAADSGGISRPGTGLSLANHTSFCVQAIIWGCRCAACIMSRTFLTHAPSPCTTHCRDQMMAKQILGSLAQWHGSVSPSRRFKRVAFLHLMCSSVFSDSCRSMTTLFSCNPFDVFRLHLGVGVQLPWAPCRTKVCPLFSAFGKYIKCKSLFYVCH